MIFKNCERFYANTAYLYEYIKDLKLQEHLIMEILNNVKPFFLHLF